MKKFIGILIYLVVWGAMVAWYWMGGADGGSEMGYGVIVFYIVLPVVSAVVAILYSLKDGWKKWFLLPFFGLMEVMAGWFTFDLSSAMAIGNLLMPDWHIAFYGAAPATMLMLIAWAVRTLRKDS